MTKLINEKLIKLDLELKNKNEVIEYLHSLIVKDNRICCPKFLEGNGICKKCSDCASLDYLVSLKEREKIFSTSVGELYAIPHGKSKYIKNPIVAFAKLKDEILWNEEEYESVKYIFMIGIPDGNDGANKHIDILVNLSKKIMDDDFRVGIESATKASDVLNLINN